MLETVLNHIHNWFEIRGAAQRGTFRIVSGTLSDAEFLKENQYYRITGSAFSDGVHQHPAFNMPDETFQGTVEPLGIPKAVIELANDIERWREKNPETDKISESFGGYSYTRNSGASGWQNAFKSRLDAWRKP